MLVVGLTGGIGSGKSTVANLFAKHHIPVIDADIIAKDMTQPHQGAFREIMHHFGKPILLENGTLNRAALRKIIFDHPDERQWLEKLLHPLIEKEIEKQINALSSPYCIVVIPLLIEVKPYSFINRILVIDAPKAAQIERVKKRDQVEKSHIEAILTTQASREERLKKAQDIIVNDGALADLSPKVDKLHELYLKMAEKENNSH